MLSILHIPVTLLIKGCIQILYGQLGSVVRYVFPFKVEFFLLFVILKMREALHLHSLVNILSLKRSGANGTHWNRTKRVFSGQKKSCGIESALRVQTLVLALLKCNSYLWPLIERICGM